MKNIASENRVFPSLKDILPSELPLLMGAGPVPIPESVKLASTQVINHIGPKMNAITEGIQKMARHLFRTESKYLFGVAGPSSATMEMAITNLAGPGRSVLVVENGKFGQRFYDLATKVGAEVDVLSSVEMRPFGAEELRSTLSKKKYDVVTFVHGETSCGLLNTNLKEQVIEAKKFGCLCIIDAICTLSTCPLPMDEWKIDILLTGGQKGLSSIPGVSLIAFSEEAWKYIEKKRGEIPHWCLDAKLAAGFWIHHNYHYTAPVTGLMAMYEALHLICEEGLEKRYARHALSSGVLQSCIEELGLKMFQPPEHRLHSVVAIDVPPEIDSEKLISDLLKNHNIEISGAFGLNIVRIGQMGEQCRANNLLKTISGIGHCLIKQGIDCHIDDVLATAQKQISSSPLLRGPKNSHLEAV